jgi:DNA (cytosine-5)-methyltransferase 1
MKKIKLFEAFAGYGGASFGLKKASISHEIIGFSEIDKHAIQFYKNNVGEFHNFGDITEIVPSKIPDFDLFTGGFPCQPFSQVGLGMGEKDTRGTLFHDILRICKEKKPTHILLENVKGLFQKRHKQTFQTIINSLENLGYDVVASLLNSKDYGIPQNRERVWIYAFKGRLPIFFNLEPPKKELKKFFKDYLDICPEKKLFKTEQQISRLIELYGVDFNVKEDSCVDLYNKNVRNDGISVTILEPHHNKMRIASPKVNGQFQVRNYSVNEHFKLMGFKDNELIFGEQSYTQLCKMAANGWDVNLASILYKHIFNQLENKL